MSTSDKLNYLNGTKSAIKQAIIDKGVTVSSGDSFRSYADKINQISSGAAVEEGWKPNPSWWDIEAILIADTAPYAYKVIQLIADSDVTTSLVSDGAAAYKYSDTQTLELSRIAHTWNTAQDKPSNQGFKTRYIIHYYNAQNVSLAFMHISCLYFVASGVLFTSGQISSKKLIQSFKLINNANFNMASLASVFSFTSSLVKMPMINTSNVTNFSSTFNSCTSLLEFPQLDLSKGTNFASMFSGCQSLRTLPVLNTLKGTLFGSMFSNNSAMISLPQIDLSLSTDLTNIFSSTSLVDIGFTGTIPVSTTVNHNNVNYTTLIRIVNALKDLTSLTAQTLTLGATNLSKLSAAEKAIATNKNWVLA